MELYIQTTEGKGRGVFCNEDIEKGQLIEICPVIVLPEKDRALIDKSALYDYYFLWADDHLETGIVMGFGSMYNHDYSPNAIYETYYEDQIMKVIAIENIPANTEITINYNHDPKDQTKVWFDKG